MRTLKISLAINFYVLFDYVAQDLIYSNFSNIHCFLDIVSIKVK